jgi:HEPN domain-containing protein
MAERAGDWLAQARRDLENARYNAAGEFHEWACFAAQQGAEKALKAVYQHLGGEAWGHSVFHLLEGLAGHLAVTRELLQCGRELDRHYVPARYPNGWASGAPMEMFTEEDSRRAIACGDKILRHCEGLLAGS